MDLKTLKVVRNFSTQNLVKYSIFKEIWQYLLNTEELETLTKTFKQLDINNDG
jgi:hypothetical protein